MRWSANTQDPSLSHKWFAWHPVKMGNQWVWLEYVRRRWVSSWYQAYWEYTEWHGQR